MPALSEHSNVYNTALVILRQKGFQLWQDEHEQYWAERDGWDFCAESPTSLLGLVAIFEHSAPKEPTEYWWRQREPELYGRGLLPRAAHPYESVVRKRP